MTQESIGLLNKKFCEQSERNIISCLHSVVTVEITTHNTAQTFGHFGKMVECSFMNYMAVGLNLITVT